MRIAAFISLCLFLSSCVQLSRLDSGRTVGKDMFEVGGYIALYGLDEEGGLNPDGIGLPSLGFQASYGIGNKFDINGSLNSSGNIYINPKFQIIGDQESSFAVSLLPGVDMQIGSFDGGDDPPLFLRPHFSAILSLHQNEWAIFLEPKYVYQGITESHFVGGTVGIEYLLQEKTKFALGYSYFPVLGTDLLPGSNIYNVGLGVKRRIDWY